jgi:hypothetical protein
MSAEVIQGAVRAGGVSYLGEQREIFRTGRANARVSLAALSGMPSLYALGPVEGLDGEITVFDSEPYVSKMRRQSDAFVVDRSFDHCAFFLVWTQVREWDDVFIPDTVASYRELESFVKEAAESRGMDIDVPFPFLMRGTALEIVWHVNVDRTGGRPITPELFWKSKQQYTLRGERVDIFGVHSEKHGGIFMSQDLKIHVHVVSRDSAATGHIDAIAPGSLTLRLPRPGTISRR